LYGPPSKRLLHSTLLVLLSTLPAQAQQVALPPGAGVRIPFASGDVFSGPEFNGDMMHARDGVWTLADGTKILVFGFAQQETDSSGTIRKGKFTPAAASGTAHIVRPQDWPQSARDAGEAGTALLSFVVDDKGKVRDTRVLLSSGFDDLDAASIKLASSWSFTPAKLDDTP